MTVRTVLLLAALYAAIAGCVLLAGLASGHAAPIGWRIAAEACRGDTCRPLPGSARRWGGLYACQGRAAVITAFAELMPLAPRGATVRARCIAIDRTPGA